MVQEVDPLRILRLVDTVSVLAARHVAHEPGAFVVPQRVGGQAGVLSEITDVHACSLRRRRAVRYSLPLWGRAGVGATAAATSHPTQPRPSPPSHPHPHKSNPPAEPR